MPEKISDKWRYLLKKYNQVKAKQGRIGTSNVKFKHYDTMHAIFTDNHIDAGNQIVDSSGESPQLDDLERSNIGL